MHLSYTIVREEKVDSLQEVLFASYQEERARLRDELNRGKINSVQYKVALQWAEILRKAI